MLSGLTLGAQMRCQYGSEAQTVHRREKHAKLSTLSYDQMIVQRGC